MVRGDNIWGFSDYEQIDSRFLPYVYRDNFIGGDNGSNIERAFGSIKTFKPKEPVIRYEAAAILWQLGGYGNSQYYASEPEVRKF